VTAKAKMRQAMNNVSASVCDMKPVKVFEVTVHFCNCNSQFTSLLTVLDAIG
jgi:hypothetical protein